MDICLWLFTIHTSQRQAAGRAMSSPLASLASSIMSSVCPPWSWSLPVKCLAFHPRKTICNLTPSLRSQPSSDRYTRYWIHLSSLCQCWTRSRNYFLRLLVKSGIAKLLNICKNMKGIRRNKTNRSTLLPVQLLPNVKSPKCKQSS